MKKPSFSTLTGFIALIITTLLLTASCSRSPYSFVKVQPRPFDRAAVTSVQTQAMFAKPTRPVKLSSGPAVDFNAPSMDKQYSYKTARATKPEKNTAASRNAENRKSKKENTRRVVRRELQKSAAFSALPAKKLKKVEKIISRKAEKLAEKKAKAAASPIGFNQWMKIGVILLLIGLVVGIAFADLGYIVAVIGVVFLVLGLIQQM